MEARVTTVHKILLAILLVLGNGIAISTEPSIYKDELKAMKERAETNLIVDENAYQLLGSIQAQIEEYKRVSLFQRFTKLVASRGLLEMLTGAFSFFVVSPETMPQLYQYIEHMCQTHNMPVPAIYITRPDCLLPKIVSLDSNVNALALKFFASSGIIVISRKLVEDFSANALEGVITHELGHVKNNHTNKKIVLFCVTQQILMRIMNSTIKFARYPQLLWPCNFIVNQHLVSKLIIGKRFENEADEFAFKAGKAEGLLEFFEAMEDKEQDTENEFAMTYVQLKDNKKNLWPTDYYWLFGKYAVARGLRKGYLALEWVLHNTFLDEHPSYEYRAAAARKYLAEQQ